MLSQLNNPSSPKHTVLTRNVCTLGLLTAGLISLSLPLLFSLSPYKLRAGARREYLNHIQVPEWRRLVSRERGENKLPSPLYLVFNFLNFFTLKNLLLLKDLLVLCFIKLWCEKKKKTYTFTQLCSLIPLSSCLLYHVFSWLRRNENWPRENAHQALFVKTNLPVLIDVQTKMMKTILEYLKHRDFTTGN